ncbi:MAG: ParB/RepB/Spo0J family partition protein [Deltaproteobacteria bacterium]|nr:ParB/RepB/Spo0J family partition protein [Deltaproteobacteria bacterium]
MVLETDAPKLLIPVFAWWLGKEVAVEANAGAARGVAFAAGQFAGRQKVLLAAIPIDDLQPNPQQPRRFIDPEALEELTASVRQRGILQPIIVKREGDRYLIMAGERRYRAAKAAGLTVVPAIVRDDDANEIALIENLQREDLTALEEAEGLGAMVARYGYTHQALAQLLHKSRPYVSNTLVLTHLPAEVKAELHRYPAVSREILMTIARQESETEMLKLWRRVKLVNISVHKFRESRRPDRTTSRAREVMAAARRINRKLRDFKVECLEGDERQKLTRVLRRTRKRVELLLGALGA